MKRINRLLGLTLILCLAGQNAAAQTVSKTSYFVENSTHRHLMNPALAPTRGYLSIPVAGELYIGTESNIKLTNFIYPATSTSGGKPVTFLNRSVNSADFMESLEGDQFLRTDIRTSLLSYGRWIGNSGFLTFDVGTRINVSVNLPEDLFGFAKIGMSSSAGNTYHMGNLMVNSSVIGEGALGYSLNLTDAIRIGVKGKFLAGGAYLKAGLKQMDLTMTPDNWSVTTQGQLDVYGKGVTFVKDADEVLDLPKTKIESPGLGGMGTAFDFGMEWAPIQNFKLSVAVVDFGSIKWNKENSKSATSFGTANYSGKSNVQFDSISQIGDQFNAIKTSLMEVTKFREQTVAEDFIQKLNPTINAGLELGLMSNRVSIGGLYSTRLLDNNERYTEYMASLNLKPFRWFNLSGSYSFVNGQKETFGFALGFVPGIVNIFLACDYVPTRFGKIPNAFAPLSKLTTNIQLGVSIPLSRRPVKEVIDEEETEEVPVSDEIPPQY
ncbi:MAG TPA: DUF5723 family protein [Bacteroidales bacterium]|nr:DUF5723 family protein [Bacteroidales bacterium]